MKRFLKYDYLNKKRNFCLLFLCFSILVFLYLCITLSDIRVLCIVPAIILFAFATMNYSKKGILVDFSKREIVVRDNNGKNIFSIDKIKRVSVIEIDKVNKGYKNWFALFILGAKEEIEMWDYVYNNGKVFYIVFEIKNDAGGYFVYKSYFGWMYKEKNKRTVESVEKKLYDFINDINFKHN